METLIIKKKVVKTKCIVCRSKQANYGLVGTKRQYCVICKTPEMQDYNHPKCIICNTKRAIYGLVGQKQQYCHDHKTDLMIDKHRRLCVTCGLKVSNFNIAGQPPQWCFDCKTIDMIIVTNDKCIVCNVVQAGYNFIGKKAQFCKSCKLPDMINLHARKCIKCNLKRPSFNLKGKLAEYCYDCRCDNMINVTVKKCSNCNDIKANKKYKELCLRCHTYMYPNEPNSRNYKIKEKHVTDFIQQQFHSIPIILDKKIKDGCSKRRPDVLIQLPTHNVLCEIDESKHENYDTTCEQARINNLFEDLQHIPLIMIRFNPDSYIKNGTKVKSCFTTEKASNCLTIKPDDRDQWSERLSALKETIQWALNVIPDEPIIFKYLFFDQ